MKRKQYIQIEKIKRRPLTPLTEQEKKARIYDLAEKLNVKIGGGEKC